MFRDSVRMGYAELLLLVLEKSTPSATGVAGLGIHLVISWVAQT